MFQFFLCVLYSASLCAMDHHQNSHNNERIFRSFVADQQTNGAYSNESESTVQTRVSQPYLSNSNFTSSIDSSSRHFPQHSDLIIGSSLSNRDSYYQPTLSPQFSWNANLAITPLDSRATKERMQGYADTSNFRLLLSDPGTAVLVKTKMDTVVNQMNTVVTVFDACIKSHQTGKRECMEIFLAFNEVTVQVPILHAEIMKVKQEFLNTIITSDGTFRVITSKEVDKLSKRLDRLKEQFNTWLTYHVASIAREIIEPHSKEFYNPMPNPVLVNKVLSNSINTDLKAIDYLCSQGKFEQAAPLAEKYIIKNPAVTTSEEARSADQMVRGVYQFYANGHYDSYGIRCEYIYDPLYREKVLALRGSPTPIPNEELNKFFGKRYAMMNAMASKLNKESLKPSVRSMLYKLSELHEQNPLLVIDYLAKNVAIDHENKRMRAIAPLMYGKDGLPAMYTFDTQVSHLVREIPADINTVAHAQERTLLGKLALLHMQYPEEEAYKTGITYVVQACKGHPCAAEYLNYAEALVETGIKTDQTMKADLLQCGSFYTPQVSEADKQLHKEVVTMASNLAQLASNNEMIDDKNPAHMLGHLQSAYTDYFSNPRESSEKRLKTLVNYYNQYVPKFIKVPIQQDWLFTTRSGESVPLPTRDLSSSEHNLLNDVYAYIDQQNNRLIKYIDTRQYDIAKMPTSFFERGARVASWEIVKRLPISIKSIIHPLDTALGIAHGLDLVLRGYSYIKFTYDPLFIPVQYLCPPVYERSRQAKLFAQDALVSLYNARRIEKLKMGVGILTDALAIPLLHKGYTFASSSLRNSIVEVPHFKRVPVLVGGAELAEEASLLRNAAQTEAEFSHNIVGNLKTGKGFSAPVSSMERALEDVPCLPSQSIAQEIQLTEGMGQIAQKVEGFSKAITMPSSERISYFQNVEEILAIKGDINKLPSVTFIKDGNTIKNFTYTAEEILKYRNHIFSRSHIDEGIMALGRSKPEIIDIFVDYIIKADTQQLLKNGDNTIKTIINGENTIIRCNIHNGIVRSIDGYKLGLGSSTRMLGNVISM